MAMTLVLAPSANPAVICFEVVTGTIPVATVQVSSAGQAPNLTVTAVIFDSERKVRRSLPAPATKFDVDSATSVAAAAILAEWGV